jgi:hypothetical protein
VFIACRPSLARIVALCLPQLAAGCGVPPEHSGFEAEARGAVETTMRGTPAFTPTALTLSGDSGGTLVFAGSAAAGLESGRYAVQRLDQPSGVVGPGPTSFVNVLFIAGTPSRPVGVFRGRAGVLTVTAATEARIAGRFELEAVGVLADGDQPSADSASVRLSGSFVILDPCSAATSQAAAPCARRSRRTAEGRLRFSPSESTTRSTTIRSRN